MIFQEIEGVVRELFISLDAIHFFICLEIAVLFFHRATKERKSIGANLMWGIIFSAIGFLAIGSLIRIYYVPEEVWQENITFLSLIALIPIILVVGLMEYLFQKYRKTKFFFTIIGLVLAIFTLLTPDPISTLLNNIVIIILAVFMILFFVKLIKLSSGVVRLNVILFTTTFLLFLFGNTMVTERAQESQMQLGLDMVFMGLLGRIFQIGSLILMSFVLFRLPIFFEVNWKENLIQMFIIHKANMVQLFHINFRELAGVIDEEERMDDDLVAGGLMGISAMLKEISRSSEDLKIIDHVDQKIMLEHGEFVTIALNAKQEMRIYWDKMFKLRETVESLFHDTLANWQGNLDVFEPINTIVKNEFQ